MKQSVLLAPPSSTENVQVIPKKIPKGTTLDHTLHLNKYRRLLVTQLLVTHYLNSYFGKTRRGYSSPLIELTRINNRTNNLKRNSTVLNTAEKIIESSHKLQNDFINQLPANIQPAFKELGFSNIEASQFLDTIDKFDHYLKGKHLKYTIDSDYTSDSEYPDWVQLVITIRIKSDFNAVYSNVKSRIYQILGRNVSDNLYQKLIIKIQSH